jgi:hypothetical protein
MTTNVYIVVPKLFIQLNLVLYGLKMIPMPYVHYGFLSPLHNFYTTVTAYHTDLVGEAIHFLACNYELQIRDSGGTFDVSRVLYC